MIDLPYLNLIRVERAEDGGGDGVYWKVTFEAATTDMDHAELTVEVEGETPEEALKNGRTAMEKALSHLKHVTSRWQL